MSTKFLSCVMLKIILCCMIYIYLGLHACINGYILLSIYICRHMRVRTYLRKTTMSSSHSPLLLDLHQCRQCGMVYHAKSEPVFSWDRRFMVEKCDVCKDFGYCTKISATVIL